MHRCPLLFESFHLIVGRSDLLVSCFVSMIADSSCICLSFPPRHSTSSTPSNLLPQDISHAHMLYPVNNAIATMIVADLLGLIGLNSFRTAAVLLFGLLAYDVFWVFGDDRVLPSPPHTHT